MGTSAVVQNGGDFCVALKFHPHAFCHTHHGLHDFVHSAHGIPCAEARVGVVHEAVKRGGVLGFGAQEEHRKFHDLEELGVREVLSGKGAERREQREACGVHEGLPFRELQGVVRGPVHEFVHADVVLDFGLGHERPELVAGARLDGLEDLRQRVQSSRNFKGAIVKPDGVRRVETNKVHFLVHIRPEVCEVPFKHVGHPVPTGAHVEGESFGFEFSCPSPEPVVPLKHLDLVACLGEVGGSRQSGEPRAQHQNVVVGRRIVVHVYAFGCMVQPLAGARCSLIAPPR